MSCNRAIANLGLVAAGLLIGLSMTTLALAPRLSKPIAVADVGTVAPDFALGGTDGRVTTLSALRGKTVVLFFGSLHCPITRDYNPRISKLARSYEHDPRVRFLALNVEQPGEHLDATQVRVDAKIVGRSFPTLLDERAFVAQRYSAAKLPEVVVIDPDGVVRYRGAFDDNTNETLVKSHFCSDAMQEILGSADSLVQR